MSENNLHDLAIIGGGPSGLSAVIYAVRAKLKTVLLEQTVLGGQLHSTYEVENYLGTSRINGSDLAEKFTEHAKTYNFETIARKVVEMKKIKTFYELTLSNKQIVRSISVILATGGQPRTLGIPGENELYGNGVSYCATCDGFFFRNKIVLVVGGGDSAVEEAIYLSKMCSKVYLVHRGNCLRASKILQRRLEKNGKIITIWSTVLTAIMAGKDGVSSVKTLNTMTRKVEELRTDGVFIFIGYKPNTNLTLEGVELDERGLIVTNESCETNIPGLYAAGDVRSKPARQIILSAADGCNAALAAARRIENIKETKNNLVDKI